jgi:nucleoside-diphosphate-sugar epimerase
LVGGGSKLNEQPLPEDDPKQRQPDITLAQSQFGWEPKVELEEGLPRTVEFFSTIA